MDVVIRTNIAHAETMKETILAFRQKHNIFPFDSGEKSVWKHGILDLAASEKEKGYFRTGSSNRPTVS